MVCAAALFCSIGGIDAGLAQEAENTLETQDLAPADMGEAEASTDATQAGAPADEPTDRLLGDRMEPIAPGEPGFLLERLTGGENDALRAPRILPPPTARALPPGLIAEPTPEGAYGAFQRGFYLTAMQLALPLAEDGNASAQALLGEIFAQGFAVPRDLEQASFWYSQAAAGGAPAAQFKYALMLMSGRHAARDEERGRRLMKAAADAGIPPAQFNYGQILIDENRGNSGLLEALPYFRRAAEHGIADAQYALSQIYLNASGVSEEERDSARDWLERAARAGYNTAQLDLAIWLIDGIGGETDYERGFKWMKRAATSGNVVAQNRLAHLHINAIGTRPAPVEAGKWYVLSRRAGLDDPALQDFFRGLTDDEQSQAIDAANRFRR